jgi:tripartite-type tricarboxylate transporter receptor subunit TctC
LRSVGTIILAASTPNIITVNPAVPAKNLAELVALARKEPLSYASSGIGTTTHLTMERLKTAPASTAVSRGGAESVSSKAGIRSTTDIAREVYAKLNK